MKNTCLLFLFPCLAGAVLAQGDLTPPGPPVPSMKSLDQIEARTPLSGPAPITISTEGSYYLTQNVSAIGVDAIVVNASHVTIDLNGFALIGDQSQNQNGILVNSPVVHVTVRNGKIRNFGGAALNANGSSVVRVENLVARNNIGGGLILDLRSSAVRCTVEFSGGNGIRTGDNSIVRECVVTSNHNTGIAMTAACTLLDCTSSLNDPYGIAVGAGSTVVNCTATGNTGSTGNCGGILAGNNCVLSNCTSSVNTWSQGTQGPTTGFGFSIGSNCVMTNCTAGNNKGDGIAFGGNCLISGNNAAGNSFAGLHSTGSLNRIDGNTAVGNGGAGVLWGNDLVIRNSAFANTPNYNPAVGTGNSGPLQVAPTANNPFANF